MNVTLLAATGRAGSTILAELIRRGHRVTAVARNIAKLPSDLPGSVLKVQDDLSDTGRLAEIVKGSDVVISAFGPASSDPRYTTDIAFTDQLVTVTERAITAVRTSHAGRLIVVGGAGSLEFAPGVTVLDSGHWPEAYVPIAKSHVKAFAALRESGLNWSYFSPPVSILPGERTGKFRTGSDKLIRDEEGKSHISFEDYAVALVDEMEHPQHERARFTAAY